MAIVAAFALVFSAFRPISEERAVEIATQQFLNHHTGSKRAQIQVKSREWDSQKKLWVILLQYRLCFTVYSVDSSGKCSGSFLFCG